MEKLHVKLPDDVLMAVRGYAVCPHCLTQDRTDCFGDDSGETTVSHWECERCGTIFSVYDEHPDYTDHGWLGEDHHDFYYTLRDVQWGDGALIDRRVQHLFNQRFPKGSAGPPPDFDIVDLYIQAHEDLAVDGICYQCGCALPVDGICYQCGCALPGDGRCMCEER